jgi:hypothetical protein
LPWLGLLAVSVSGAHGMSVASAGGESATIAIDRPVSSEPCDPASSRMLQYAVSNSWLSGEFADYCPNTVPPAQQDQTPPGVGAAAHGLPALVPDAGQTAPLVAPVHFDQVLLTVDFPAGAWTPIHTSGGYVSSKVIEGVISTRTQWSGGVHEATYEVGDTFVSTPGMYRQLGNATASKARVMSAAVLPIGAPMTIYQDGYTTNAYPTLTDWNWAHGLEVLIPGPTTVHRASIEWNGIPRSLDNTGRAVDGLSLYGDRP